MSFIFYPYCVPVKGYNRSVVCNLQKGTFDYISNTLYEQIAFGEKFDALDVDHAIEFQGDARHLSDSGYGYFEQEGGINPQMLKKIDLSHHTPSLIDNACIIIDNVDLHDYDQIRLIIDSLLTRAAQFIFLSKVDADEVDKVLSRFLDTTLYSIELVLPYNESFALDDLQSYKRLSSIHFYNASDDNEIVKYDFSCTLSKGKLDFHSKCGVRNNLSFGINYELFSESMHFNNCLHKKMTIDETGNIKNCPSSISQFGNIYTSDFEIEDILKNKKFTKNWNITKDMVKDCQVCELRYICLDCRVFTTNDENLTKPANCNYDPYSSTWNK